MSFGPFRERACISLSAGALLTALSIFSYLHFQQREMGSSPDWGIPWGDRYYIVRAKGVCVGGVHSDVRREENILIDMSGEVRVRYNQTSIPITFNGSARSNSLDQLGGLYVRVRSDKREIVAGTLGVNPITFEFRMRNGAAEIHRSRDFPGPILLTTLPSGSLTIRHRDIPLSMAGNKDFPLRPVLEGLHLTLVESSVDAFEACVSRGDRALDITHILRLLGPLAKSAEGLIEGKWNPF